MCRKVCEMEKGKPCKGGLVGGRKAEICSFRCLPTKVQPAHPLWRQLCFELILWVQTLKNQIFVHQVDFSALAPSVIVVFPAKN